MRFSVLLIILLITLLINCFVHGAEYVELQGFFAIRSHDGFANHFCKMLFCCNAVSVNQIRYSCSCDNSVDLNFGTFGGFTLIHGLMGIKPSSTAACNATFRTL